MNDAKLLATVATTCKVTATTLVAIGASAKSDLRVP